MGDWPGGYLFVGIGGLGPDTGVELLENTGGRTVLELEALFYRQRGVELYTMSVGRSSGGATQEGEGPRRAFEVVGPERAYVKSLE